MEKHKNIMNFKKFLQYFKIKESSSFKEDRLNQILDKMSDGIKLTEKEKKFLDEFNTSSDEDYKDFKMLSKDSTFSKLLELLEMDKNIICNISDRDGKIGIKIKSVYNNYEVGKTFIKLLNNEEVELKDNFFYDINYNFKKDEYSLEELDEFYEKIPVKND